MAKETGWIKLHRSSFDNKLYFAEPFSRWQAWCDLLLLANHKEGLYYIRGVQINVKRGTVGYGVVELCLRWKWSRGKVERYLQFLEHKTVNQIVRQKNNVTTLISIVNYEKYQSLDKANNNDNNNTDGQQIVKQTDINKNVKELEECNNTNTPIVKLHENFKKNGNENFKSGNNNLSGTDIYAARLQKARKANIGS